MGKETYPVMQSAAVEQSPSDSIEPAPALVYAVVILSAATTLYFALVGRTGVFLFVDEFHSLANLDRGYGFLFSTFDARGSGIALPLLQRLTVDLLGDSLFAYRLPAALGALAATLLCYPVAKRLVGPIPALISVLALCSNSFFIYYSRLGRSYTLAVFLVLWVVFALHTALVAKTARAHHYAMLALAVGLAPFVHLVTFGIVAATLAAGVATLAVRGDWERHGRWLLGSLVSGGLLAGLLHLPAIGEVSVFLDAVVVGTKNQYLHDGTFISIVGEVLAGGRGASLFWWLGLPVAAVWFVRMRRSDSFVLLAAAFSSLVVVSLLTPRGAPVAWARYLLVSSPFILMLLAWLVVQSVRFLPLARHSAERVALGIGVGLVVVNFSLGPLGLHHVADGPFSNGYLSTRTVVANNIPWPETPSLYRELASAPDDAVVIEAPVLSGRSAQLYRNYYLQHGRRVLMGAVDVAGAETSASVWPYVPLLERGAIRASGADYLIVHLNVEEEAIAYEAFVHGVDRAPQARRVGVPGTRHGLLLKDYARSLEGELGVPLYRDQRIVAWKLSNYRTDPG